MSTLIHAFCVFCFALPVAASQVRLRPRGCGRAGRLQPASHVHHARGARRECCSLLRVSLASQPALTPSPRCPALPLSPLLLARIGWPRLAFAERNCFELTRLLLRFRLLCRLRCTSRPTRGCPTADPWCCSTPPATDSPVRVWFRFGLFCVYCLYIVLRMWPMRTGRFASHAFLAGVTLKSVLRSAFGLLLFLPTSGLNHLNFESFALQTRAWRSCRARCTASRRPRHPRTSSRFVLLWPPCFVPHRCLANLSARAALPAPRPFLPIKVFIQFCSLVRCRR